MVILSKFAETLGDLLFEQKTDAKTLSARIGVEGSTVTRYLRTDRAPSIQNLILLADYFQCSTDFLLGLENENHTHTFTVCPPFSVQIGKVLQHFGCSFYRLSVEANIHQSTVYDWKSGKRVPTLDNVVKIAEFFDCTVDFVLGREV
jgi:hypothetical protein